MDQERIDLLEEYSEIVSRYRSIRSLEPGDTFMVHAPHGAFAYGSFEGKVILSEIEDHKSNCSCVNNRICMYILDTGRPRGKCGSCGCRLYDKDGERFIEDFEYYKKYPTYSSCFNKE